MKPCASPCGLLAALVLAGFAAVSTASMWNKSATADEPIYMAAGLKILETGDLEINAISSPYLLKPWLALPLKLAGERFPVGETGLSSPSLADNWQASWRYLYSPGLGAQTRLRLARGMNILLGVGCGLLTWLLGRRIGGPALGLAALVLFLSHPETLAHTRFASLDIGLAFFTLLTLLLGLPLLGPAPVGRLRVGATGVALGACLLVKTATVTLVFFFAVAVALAFLRPVRRWLFAARDTEGDGRAPWPLAGRVLAVFVVALLTVNAAFGFRGSLDTLREHEVWPRIEARLQDFPAAATALAGAAPLPLPGPYVDLLLAQVEIGSRPKWVFFHGEARPGGWRWFLPAAWSARTPLPHLALLLLAVGLWAARRSARGDHPERSRAARVTFLATAAVWGFYLATDRFGFVRYLLPILPLMMVLAGTALVALWSRGRALRLAGALLLVWIAVADARAFPHYLSWVNEGLGGQDAAHLWLADSNCDWGQDLAYAADYVRREGLGRVALAYFGSGRPREYGLEDYELLPSVGAEPPRPGDLWWYESGPPLFPDPLPDLPIVASATIVAGIPFGEPDFYAPLRRRRPDALITPTMLLYLPPHR